MVVVFDSARKCDHAATADAGRSACDVVVHRERKQLYPHAENGFAGGKQRAGSAGEVQDADDAGHDGNAASAGADWLAERNRSQSGQQPAVVDVGAKQPAGSADLSLTVTQDAGHKRSDDEKPSFAASEEQWTDTAQSPYITFSIPPGSVVTQVVGEQAGRVRATARR